MEHDDIPVNESGNTPFMEVDAERRRLLGRGLQLLGGLALPGSWRHAAAAPAKPLIGFEAPAAAACRGPEPAISPDYRFDVILPWGTPLASDGPAFARPVEPAAQAAQLGSGHDGMWLFPLPDTDAPRAGWNALDDPDPWRGQRVTSAPGNRGVLCLNHEFCSNRQLFGGRGPQSLDEVRASQHAHGVSVIPLQRTRAGRWQAFDSPLARRIHANTPVSFSGPAADHPALLNPAGNTPCGTLNNCGMGYTPWGTYLTCEENFHGYFATEEPGWGPDAQQRRYGIRGQGFRYGWHRFDPRFDVAQKAFRNEHNRFGWVVEIDPFDPAATPVKRTALGRKHNEGATVHVADDGRVVVYNGDDSSFEYIYKFVSRAAWRAMRSAGESPLDHGTLYAARFEADGSGRWLPLNMDNPVLGEQFSDLGSLLINARHAADLAGATPMDRPEWITVAADGQVYASLTGNRLRDAGGPKTVSGRAVDTGPDAANPRAPNPAGHIVRWREDDGHAGERFSWDVFCLGGEPSTGSHDLANPDSLWADPDGRLFICTDGTQSGGLNNQLLVADTLSGQVRRLFSGVSGCEITGITVTPDRRTLFVNVQHPGNGDPRLSSFPAPYDGSTHPRDATVAITRRDGGIVGS